MSRYRREVEDARKGKEERAKKPLQSPPSVPFPLLINSRNVSDFSPHVNLLTNHIAKTAEQEFTGDVVFPCR